MNEQVDDTCLGTRLRSLSNLWYRGRNCLEDEIDKDRELLQKVGIGIYTIAPCAQTRCAQTMLTNIWNQKKSKGGKEKNQKRKTLSKKERRVSQQLELIWVVRVNGTKVVWLRIETI